MDLIIASKGKSQQIGVPAVWLHLYRPFPFLFRHLSQTQGAPWVLAQLAMNK